MNQEIAPMGRVREASRLGRKVMNQEIAPMGRVREASWLGKKVRKRENAPTEKRIEKKKVWIEKQITL